LSLIRGGCLAIADSMRNFDRYNISSQAVIILNTQNKRVLIQDFSRMGVGFVSEDILKLKSFISLLYQNEKNQIIQMQSYVKHIRKLKNGLWFVGVQFVGIETKFDRAA
jgi:hypothetical protein